jgi:tRNA threonylcarbamoyladenosine biosynthesis protein TsaB
MTTLLALETSTDLASVALISDRQITYRDLSGVQTHSFGLLPAVQDLLRESGIQLSQLDAIAFGCGPGAFTGVRTACGVVQGLAFGLQIPVLPVVSLLAMAEAAKSDHQLHDVVCCLDARMDEVYWAHYRFQENTWNALQEPVLGNLHSALDYAQSLSMDLVFGNGLALPQSYANLKLFIEMPHAKFALAIAEKYLQDGLQYDATQAQPLYLRNKIALTTAERILAASV